MNYDEKLYAIFDHIGRHAVLEQCIEECGEFVQAAAKQLRIFRGANYTPVTLTENSNNLIEEAADLSLCLDLLAVSFGNDAEATRARIAETKAAKLDRWLARLGITEKTGCSGPECYDDCDGCPLGSGE